MQPSSAALLRDLEHGDEIAQIESAKMLCCRPKQEVLSPLIALLRTAENQRVRKWAACTLGFLHDRRAGKVLIAALRNRANDIDVRCHAAEALGHLLQVSAPDAEAVAALHEAIEDDSPDLRFWSAFALGAIGDEASIPVLQRLADSDDRVIARWWSIRAEALDAIARIHRDGGHPKLAGAVYRQITDAAFITRS